jgi:hypothetical protein
VLSGEAKKYQFYIDWFDRTKARGDECSNPWSTALEGTNVRTHDLPHSMGRMLEPMIYRTRGDECSNPWSTALKGTNTRTHDLPHSRQIHYMCFPQIKTRLTITKFLVKQWYSWLKTRWFLSSLMSQKIPFVNLQSMNVFKYVYHSLKGTDIMVDMVLYIYIYNQWIPHLEFDPDLLWGEPRGNPGV